MAAPGPATQETEVMQELRLLTDVLKLHKLKLKHAANQMQFKIKATEQARVIQEQISQFCAPQNITQLV